MTRHRAHLYALLAVVSAALLIVGGLLQLDHEATAAVQAARRSS